MNNSVKMLSPFVLYCQKVIPLAFDESMSYYECLCALYSYLKEQIVPAVNNNAEALKEVQEKMIELKNYVDHYFDNLDLQSEVDAKLDDMAESGELAEIIAQYLEIASVLGFDTVATMKASDNLVQGSICKTVGQSSYNDGLGSFYRVRQLTVSDVIDGVNIVALDNSDTLIAEKIYDIDYKRYEKLADVIADTHLMAGDLVKILGYYAINDGGEGDYLIREKGVSETANNITTYELNNELIAEIIDNSIELYAKKYGVKCDKVSDDATRLQAVINYCHDHAKTLVLDGYAYVSTTIDTKAVKIRGLGKIVEPSYTYTSSLYGYIGFDYLKNINNGALITFSDYVGDTLTTGSGIISDTANPILSVSNAEGRFDLQDITVCGWLRNGTQVGIKNVITGTPAYVHGAHKFNNISVINCGSHGIDLSNLEMTTAHRVVAMLNFGCGIHIEAEDDIDTPTEYVKLEECRLCGNKLGGLYINKGFNKQLIIEHCEFTSSGLYSQLNVSIPASKSDVVAGVSIVGYKNNQMNLKIVDSYGENLNQLIKINTSTGSHIFNKIMVVNNTLYGLDANACLLYLNTYYSSGMEFHDNTVNNGDQFVYDYSGGEIIPFNCDQYVLNSINVLPTVTISSSLTVTQQVIQRYDNLVYVKILGTANTNIPAWTTLVSNFPKPMENTQMLFKVGTTFKYQTWYTNRNASSGDTAISNGTEVVIWGTYFVAPYSDSNGNY